MEIALKMSFHFWRNHGQPDKNHFLCLAGSYHGETLGTLGVSGQATGGLGGGGATWVLEEGQFFPFYIPFQS